MDKQYRRLFNDQILTEAASRWGVAPAALKELDGFESFIYEFEQEGQGRILRIGHSGHRPSGQVCAEVDWLQYLARHGVRVPGVIPSQAGRLVEPFPVGQGEFLAVVFTRAPGGPPERQHWTPPFFRQMGAITGRMHALAKEYTPPGPHCRRPEWRADQEGFAEKYLPPSEQAIIARWNELLAYLETLPKGRDAYGLIHQDFHGGNFFVDGDGQITLFDFDDCQYAWFAYDIAMALFYVVPHRCERPEDLAKARQFFDHFMAGYREENDLDPAWLKEIPHFMKLREIDLYIAIHRSLDLENLDPWTASFMKGRKERIEQGLPYLEMDF